MIKPHNYRFANCCLTVRALIFYVTIFYFFRLTTSALENATATSVHSYRYRKSKLSHKVRRDTSMDKLLFYDPCDYPRPSDADEFATRCASAYLGSNVFCDPNHQFSRTEADSLSSDLSRLNISSCLCNNPITLATGSFETCSEFRGAVLFAPNASLILKRAPENNFRERKNRRDDVCRESSMNSPHEMTRMEQMEKFAQQLVRIWHDDSRCELDLLFIVVNRWHPYLESEDVARVIVFVSRRLQLRLKKLDQKIGIDQEELEPISVHTVSGRSMDAFVNLKLITAKLTKGIFTSWNEVDQKKAVTKLQPTSPSSVIPIIINPQESFQTVGTTISMPDWAIILFIVCILMLPLCVLIGNLVSVVPSRRMSQATPDQMSMRWAHKRWRAGFGGGFFGVRWKTQMTTAGDPATASCQQRAKPQSNNMMFRQFSKFKKPLKPVSNSGAEPSKAGWSYV